MSSTHSIIGQAIFGKPGQKVMAAETEPGHAVVGIGNDAAALRKDAHLDALRVSLRAKSRFDFTLRLGMQYQLDTGRPGGALAGMVIGRGANASETETRSPDAPGCCSSTCVRISGSSGRFMFHDNPRPRALSRLHDLGKVLVLSFARQDFVANDERAEHWVTPRKPRAASVRAAGNPRQASHFAGALTRPMARVRIVCIRTKYPENVSMSTEQFIRTLRSLAECYQAFEAYSALHVRKLGLTSAQFDIIATLGNTPGMTCKELAEKTLITKGTLTGVLDRLEARRLIRRSASDADRRQIFVALTPQGIRTFEHAFPAHIGHLKQAFTALSASELDQTAELLHKLRDALRDARGRRPMAPDLTAARRRYSAVAIALHWLIAAAILCTFVLAQYMTELEISPTKLKLYAYHKWIGVTIFMLVLVRLGWRLSHRPPPPPVTMPAWQHSAANITHFFLYALTLLIPLSGWLMSSALGFQVVYLGVLPIPDLLGKNKEMADQLMQLHEALNWLMVLLIALHVAAALKHHLVDRDDVLRRMLPFIKQRSASK